MHFAHFCFRALNVALLIVAAQLLSRSSVGFQFGVTMNKAQTYAYSQNQRQLKQSKNTTSFKKK